LEPIFFVSHWVYILTNPQGRFYVGQTESIAKRLTDHNRTDAFEGKYTRKNGPWNLIWAEEHPDRNSAVRRERMIKRMKSSKWIREKLLPGQSAVNPDASGL
jgi:putative endonuclease